MNFQPNFDKPLNPNFDTPKAGAESREVIDQRLLKNIKATIDDFYNTLNNIPDYPVNKNKRQRFLEEIEKLEAQKKHLEKKLE